ncbi:hypothetical protein Dsin_015072 [Dipteronia sinensis]|uniref:Uncharacterized protein n=1 Tax=Dipteronia sinensis TaxID=43782 RepID=A0AAE0AND2_9ROSI|nr:hypothetical protein Dsin_015072 [Dipteronia sinensis]
MMLGHQLRVYCKASGSPWLKAVKERGDDHDLGEIGNFLEKCYFCRKSSLHAFFTPECREKQIAVDKVVAKQPRGTGNECNRRNDVKDQSGLANCASSQSIGLLV